MKTLYWIGFVALCGTSLTGCSKEPEFATGTISGVALLGSDPLKVDGVLMFLDPATGVAATAEIGENGDFKLETPIRVGTYTVYLAPKVVEPAPGEEPPPFKIDTSLPDKYWNEATSDLTVEVKEGENAKVSIVFET